MKSRPSRSVAHARDDIAAWWFAPEPEINLRVARVLLALTALWVVLSRFDLPSILQLPQPLWDTVSFESRARFLLLLPVAIERVLWIALHVSLLLALFGVKERWSCIASGLLLYHFAPLETIIWTTNPYLRGLTIPCLGLLILGFAQRAGWGLRLTQFILCCIYFFAGYAKLFTSGLEWASPHNIRLYLIGLDDFLGFHTSLARFIADQPALCRFIGIFGIAFELLFPVILVRRSWRRVFVPLAVVFHILNSWLFHVFFHDIAILLIFFDFSGARDAFVRWRAGGNRGSRTAATAPEADRAAASPG